MIWRIMKASLGKANSTIVNIKGFQKIQFDLVCDGVKAVHIV